MRELVRMVVVLTVICAASGFVLSYVNEATQAPREYQLLKYVQEPSIKAVLPSYSNDPIKDRIELTMGKNEKGEPVKKTIFPAKENGKVVAIAYGSAANGYHGPIDVMVGIDPEGKLTGVSVMTHTETPGLGARVVEPAFSEQFAGLEMSGQLNVTAQGGKINAVSGATLSSKGVVNAVRSALEVFPQVKKEVF